MTAGLFGKIESVIIIGAVRAAHHHPYLHWCPLSRNVFKEAIQDKIKELEAKVEGYEFDSMVRNSNHNEMQIKLTQENERLKKDLSEYNGTWSDRDNILALNKALELKLELNTKPPYRRNTGDDTMVGNAKHTEPNDAT